MTTLNSHLQLACSTARRPRMLCKKDSPLLSSDHRCYSWSSIVRSSTRLPGTKKTKQILRQQCTAGTYDSLQGCTSGKSDQVLKIKTNLWRCNVAQHWNKFGGTPTRIPNYASGHRRKDEQQYANTSNGKSQTCYPCKTKTQNNKNSDSHSTP